MWMKVFKQQNEAYMRVLGAFAEKIPHENAAQIAREAEAVKKTVRGAEKRAKSVPPKSGTKNAALVTA